MPISQRARTLTRWTALTLTASLAAVVLVSTQWYFGYDAAPSSRLCIAAGSLLIGDVITPPLSPLRTGLIAGPAAAVTQWGFRSLTVWPIRMALIPFALATLVTWWSTLFRKKGHAAREERGCATPAATTALASPPRRSAPSAALGRPPSRSETAFARPPS